MILMVMTMLIFVVCLIGIVTYKVSITLQMDDAKANDVQKVQFISENIDATILDINRVMDSITQDAELQSILNQERNDSTEMIALLEKNLLSKTIYSTDIVKSLYFFDNQKLLIKIDYDNSEYNRNVNTNDLTPNRLHYHNVGRITWRIENDVIYIDRSIRDRESQKVIGYITFALKEDYLARRLQLEKHRYTYVFNQYGDIVVSSNNETEINAEHLLLQAEKEMDGIPTTIRVYPYGEMLLTTNVSKFGEWRVVSCRFHSRNCQGPEMIGIWIIFIGLIGVLVGGIITWFATKKLISPLYDLKHVMDQIEADSFQYMANIVVQMSLDDWEEALIE